MAVPFDVELSIADPPAEVEARAADALAAPTRRVGLRLTKHHSGELGYSPRVQFPLLLVVWNTLTGTRMTVNFVPAEGGGTRVRIRGAVPRARQPLAADPELWAEALGATPSSAS